VVAVVYDGKAQSTSGKIRQYASVRSLPGLLQPARTSTTRWGIHAKVVRAARWGVARRASRQQAPLIGFAARPVLGLDAWSRLHPAASAIPITSRTGTTTSVSRPGEAVGARLQFGATIYAEQPAPTDRHRPRAAPDRVTVSAKSAGRAEPVRPEPVPEICIGR
jgi:hypothetical protein